jgi:hypothetical protein
MICPPSEYEQLAEALRCLACRRTRGWLAVCFSLTLLTFCAIAAEAQQILLVSPALPTAADEVTVFLSVVGCSFRVTSSVQGNTVYLYPDTSSPCPPLAFPDPGLVTGVILGPFSAGSFTLVVVTNGTITDSRALFVQEPPSQLALLKGRFAVTATFTSQDGKPGATANAVQLGDASGYFWFFEKTAVELTVKMLDGYVVNRRYWVFVSSATNVPFTLRIVDTWLCSPPTPACPTRTYQGTAGLNQNFIDTSAFSYY